MRTIKEMLVEIADIKHDIETREMKKPEETRLRKRVAFLRTCIRYIETNPDENFISDQIKMVESKINLRMKGFNEDAFNGLAKSEVSKMRRAYEKEYEIPKLRNQVKTMRFLLK